MKGGFVLYNGRFFKESEKLFSSADAFRLEVGIKEMFRTENNEILFAEKVYKNLLDACDAVDISIPEDFDIYGRRLRKDVSRLLNKNKYYLAASIVVRIFPGNKTTDCIISASEVTRGYYPLNPGGLLLGFYDETSKNESQLSRFEFSSRFLWIKAAFSARANAKNNMIILNTEGYACECIGASFAYVKGRKVIFPDATSGGYCSVLSEPVQICAARCGLDTAYSEQITVDNLLDADEIFIIDNSLGIQKVLGLENRRYYSKITEKIADELGRMSAQSQL